MPSTELSQHVVQTGTVPWTPVLVAGLVSGAVAGAAVACVFLRPSRAHGPSSAGHKERPKSSLMVLSQQEAQSEGCLEALGEVHAGQMPFPCTAADAVVTVAATPHKTRDMKTKSLEADFAALSGLHQVQATPMPVGHGPSTAALDDLKSPLQALGRRDPTDPAPRGGSLSWDDYFMALAFLSAERSKDPNKQVGAVIVNCDNVILGIGYNGFPRGCCDRQLPWAKVAVDSRGLPAPLGTKYPYVVHAEANALLNKNAASVSGARIYVTMFPCNECAKLLIQAGIREVVYHEDKVAHLTEGKTAAAGTARPATAAAATSTTRAAPAAPAPTSNPPAICPASVVAPGHATASAAASAISASSAGSLPAGRSATAAPHVAAAAAGGSLTPGRSAPPGSSGSRLLFTSSATRRSRSLSSAATGASSSWGPSSALAAAASVPLAAAGSASSSSSRGGAVYREQQQKRQQHSYSKQQQQRQLEGERRRSPLSPSGGGKGGNAAEGAIAPTAAAAAVTANAVQPTQPQPHSMVTPCSPLPVEDTCGEVEDQSSGCDVTLRGGDGAVNGWLAVQPSVAEAAAAAAASEPAVPEEADASATAAAAAANGTSTSSSWSGFWSQQPQTTDGGGPMTTTVTATHGSASPRLSASRSRSRIPSPPPASRPSSGQILSSWAKSAAAAAPSSDDDKVLAEGVTADPQQPGSGGANEVGADSLAGSTEGAAVVMMGGVSSADVCYLASLRMLRLAGVTLRQHRLQRVIAIPGPAAMTS